jgi:hypothetical protein
MYGKQGLLLVVHFEAGQTMIRALCGWEILTLALSVCVVIGPLIGCDDRAVPNRDVFSVSAEQSRVTSPNGQLDAVLVRDPYGGAVGGGINWNVYITTKGTPIHMKADHELFQADPLTGGQLVWKRDRLLEIHYDIADIQKFRNLWGLDEVEDVGSSGERDYEVEIQLMPASDSSALAPDGSFRNP